jgi:hypothetical protein
MKTLLRYAHVVLFPLLAGCSHVTGSELEIKPMQIDSIEALVAESLPVQVSAHVKGVIGDGCTELRSARQEREDSAVRIEILVQRPKDAVCTQIAKLYDETIPLEGDFPPGRYTLQVNEATTSFQVD